MMQAETVDYIRFTTISPGMVKKMSVAKLIVPDTYNEDGYPIDGGLIDQRLGVIDPGLKCKTCGGRAKTCTGHFGHIELVRPVVHPEFAKTIYLLLQSTCESCHRILLDEKQMEQFKPVVRNLITTDVIMEDNVETEGKLAMLTKKLKSVKKCPSCGTPQQKLKFERPTFFYLNSNKLKPDEIRDWLSKISDDDLSYLGIDGKATRPEWLVLTMLLVPPVNVRPSITLETGERSEDDLTHKLVEIMRINQRLEQDIDAGAPQIIIDDLWELLQYHVTTYFNNETPGVPVARHRSTRPLKTLAQRLKGKEGRLRYNLSGKRVNFSARSVISCDTRLGINEVGIPMRLAENLTVPFYVTKWNLEQGKKFLASTKWPSVLNVIGKDNMRKRVTDLTRDELLAAIEPGQVLERQLIDGDLVLFNRQPTLHKFSIMAHRARILPGKTLRVNVSITMPYGADFDGDEMNIHVPQSLEALAEARYLMQPKDLLLSSRDGRPISFLMEDQIAGIYFLTKDDAKFTKDEACIMLGGIGISELPKPQKDGTYSGKSIFSILLPKDLNYTGKNSRGAVTIKNGDLVEGVMDNKLVGGGGALLTKLFFDYGADFTSDFIFKAATIALRTDYTQGLTVSIRDYYNTPETNRERDIILRDAEDKVKMLVESYKVKKLESLPGYTRKETFEMLVIAELAHARERAVSYLNKTLDESNNAFLLATIGARGSLLNMAWIKMFLGQQQVRGKRPMRGYKGRVLPYFERNSNDPTARGFVEEGFMNGLEPLEMYLHAMGSRDSTMTKSLVTAVSGYLQRRLINALQDFYVDTNLSVKDASGALIQTIYGGDGTDPAMGLVEKEKSK
jgi:DNA-directed RNA polymerase subunit A'